MGSHYAMFSLPPTSYGLRENPKKSMRLVDPEFYNEGQLIVNKEHQPESSAQGNHRRISVEDDQEVIKKKCVQESSIEKQCAFELVEDVVWCFVGLSRDEWTSSDPEMRDTKGYACETCKKTFKSPQGFGSQKASYDRKAKNPIGEDFEDNIRKRKNVVEEQVYECSFCDKIFKSAQALGGHKRSHLLASKFGESSTSTSISDTTGNFGIYLNMPPRTEDEDEKIIG